MYKIKTTKVINKEIKNLKVKLENSLFIGTIDVDNFDPYECTIENLETICDSLYKDKEKLYDELKDVPDFIRIEKYEKTDSGYKKAVVQIDNPISQIIADYIFKVNYTVTNYKNIVIRRRRKSYQGHNQKALNGGGIYTDAPSQGLNNIRHNIHNSSIILKGVSL